MKLDSGSLHLMRLAIKGTKDGDGWAKVSAVVWPSVVKLPDDLVEKRPSDEGGHVRLTVSGEAVVFYSR